MPKGKDSSRSWAVAVGTFLLMFLETGVIKSLGVLLPSIREQFATRTWVVGFVIALVPGFGSVICLLSGAVTKVLSPRPTIAVCGLLSAFGLIGCSQATDVYTLGVSLLLTGFSTGTTTVSIGALSHYFDKYYDIAAMSSMCGMSFGIVIMPVLGQFFLNIYGWRGSALLLGGLTLNSVVCSLPFTPLKDDRGYHLISTSKEPAGSVNNWYTFIIDKLDMHLFANISFVNLVIVKFGVGFSITGWLIYLIPHALDVGFAPYRASAVATAGGIGTVVGNCIYPILCKIVSKKLQMYIGVLAMSAALLLDTVASSLYSSYLGMVMCSIVYGFAKGLEAASWTGLVNSVVDDTEIINAISWAYAAYGLAAVLSGFISGWLFDKYGNYTVSFLVLGGVNAATLIPQCIMDIIQLTRSEVV